MSFLVCNVHALRAPGRWQAETQHKLLAATGQTSAMQPALPHLPVPTPPHPIHTQAHPVILIAGLVLLNSAGLLVPDYEPPTEQPAASPPPPFVVNAVSQVGCRVGAGPQRSSAALSSPVPPSNHTRMVLDTLQFSAMHCP